MTAPSSISCVMVIGLSGNRRIVTMGPSKEIAVILAKVHANAVTVLRQRHPNRTGGIVQSILSVNDKMIGILILHFTQDPAHGIQLSGMVQMVLRQKIGKGLSGKQEQHRGFRRTVIDHIPRQQTSGNVRFVPVKGQRTVI